MKRILVALAVIGAIVLSGCSKMDLAASVGETEFSLSQLQSKVDAILAEREKVDTSQMQLESGADLTRSQLSFLVSNQIIELVALDEGIKLTDSQIESYRLQVVQNIGGEAMLPAVLVNAAIAPDSLTDVLRRDLILQAISEKARAAGADDAGINDVIQRLVTEKADSLKIDINPRYGKWDSTTFAIVPVETAGDAVTEK